MKILVINCGSSSVKGAVLDHESGELLARMRIERIGESQPTLALDDDEPVVLQGKDHEQALGVGIPQLLDRLGSSELDGVGHRVVHGGERFSEPVRIDDDVESAIEELIPLAPLHNPANLAGIRAARKALPKLTHVAVFDTAFHATLPTRAKAYAIDKELADKHGVRRYGFHGTSHRYVAHRAARFLDQDIQDLRLITVHLGNGASICAVEFGRSVETSMGMTPLEGLVMGTRCGDVDPGVLIHLMRSEGLDVDALDQLLNKKSGLTGLSGVGNDMRDIEERAGEGDDRCRLALQVFAHRVRKYVGAYAAVLGGVDAIVFTGGIGENSAQMRHRIAQRLDFLGARLDEEKNRDVAVSRDTPVVQFSTATSRAHLLAVATDEQHAIA
ncbi:MAG TPA: acetate kinase, partial [Polyangiaceae bacterium]|nr:acetate kinase [Polyangiaceae bacterium]